MRAPLIAVLFASLTAHADPAPAYKLVPDAALGGAVPALTTTGADAGVAACLAKTPPTASAVFWLEVGKSGAATAARVHGSGSKALDACLATALKKVTTTEKPAGPLVLAGHLDLAEQPSARISTVAVMVDPKGAAWQLGAKRIGYTANRAADISQAMDSQAAAIAACAAKRGKKIAAADMIAFSDGTAVVRGSGDPSYDACLAKAFSAIKLPAAESALWMELELRQPGEPLAPKGTTHDQAVKTSLHDAVKSKRVALDACLDKHPNAKLGTVSVALVKTKVSVTKISTGDAGVDACVKKLLEAITVPRAADADTAQVDVTYD